MNSPKVSIVMPIYNSESFLEEAIKSMLNQSYQDFEFIIVDDASQDRSLDIVKAFSKKDKRIKVYHNDINMGISKSRNIGLSHAKGEYYAVMDHDDISMAGRLEKQVNFLDNHCKYVAVGCQVEIINGKGKKIGVRRYPESNEQILQSISIKSPLCNPATMIRVSGLTEFGYYDTNFSGTEDYEMWFKLASKYKLANLKEPLFQYRLSKKQFKSKKVKQLLFETVKIKRKWVFTKRYFNIKALCRFFLEQMLLLFPDRFILNLFIFLSYERQR